MFPGITFDPPFPAAAILGVGAVLTLLVILAYRRAQGRSGRIRRALLTILRVAAIAGVVGILLRPMRVEPAKAEGAKPVFAIVLDSSASMKTADVDGVPRYQAVSAALEETQDALIRGLATDHDLRVFRFDKELEPATFQDLTQAAEPQGMTTDIGAALMQAAASAANRPSSGLLFISDGRDNARGDVEQAAIYLKSRKVPVWTVPVGSDTESKDLFVTARLSQNFLFVNQPATLKATLSQSGYADWYAKVNLYRDGEYVTTQQVMLRGNTGVAEFPIEEDHKGVYRYSIKVEPLPDEADTSNNDRTIFARVVDEKSRVLFVEARPYWDSKFLLRALQQDPNLEVTSIFQLTPNKVFSVAEKPTGDIHQKTAVTQGVYLPRTTEELYRYDCIIFGKGIDLLFSSEQLKLLRDYVMERGGSIVFARGRAYGFESETLAALEPVEWSDDVVRRARIELTPEGKDSPLFAFGHGTSPDVILRELPEMVSVTKVENEKSLSVILARVAQTDDPGVELGSKIAAISYQRYGRGKVMSIGTAGLWRWAFMPPDLSEYDDIYIRFWSQMIRWLIFDSDFLPGQEISFRTGQYAYNLGERTLLTVLTQFVDDQDFQPEVTIHAPDGSTTVIALPRNPNSPGTYSAHYLPTQEGEYEAVMRSTVGEPREAAERFTVYADSVENRFVAADPDLLGRIASVTGGETLALNELSGLPGKVSAFEQLARDDVKPVDAWDTLAVFVILMALFGVEWLARRQTGLV